METGMNTLQSSNKIYNFTLTVSPHYLIKLNQHILKSVVTVFYYSTAKMSLWAKWAVFLQIVFKLYCFLLYFSFPSLLYYSFIY